MHAYPIPFNIVYSMSEEFDMAKLNTLLSHATRKPQVDQEVVYDQDDRGNELYGPCDYEEWSELNVQTVRQLAQCYFSHIPEIDMPINPLYHDTFEWDSMADAPNDGIQTINRYCDIIEGFMDDPHAVKYLLFRGLKPPAHAPVWVHQFEQEHDDQWQMYVALNISMENAYLDAYHRSGSHADLIKLPPEFHHEGRIC